MKQTKSITTQDFNKLCRFCAKSNNELKPIFKSDDFHCDESISITSLFRNSLNFEVIPDDRLPLLICSSCTKKLITANSFRQQCISSHEYLIELYESESERNTVDCDDREEDDVVEPIVLIKDEEQDHHSVKNESDFHVDDDPSQFHGADEPEFQVNNESNIKMEINKNNSFLNISKSEYKGRGRPRKGEEVVKQKRVPKPPQLEMCQICGQLFRSIKTHMFVHDTKPQFECHHCGRKFKHKPNLICHVKNHQNVRKFQCPQCPFKFQYSTNFKRHLRTHTGEKIFSCDICEKRFSRSGGLKRHKLTHDVPRVPCPYCEKMFTTNKGLVNHIGIHTGDRPFKCKICGAAFVASSSLCVHSRIHKKENPIIQCKECGLVVTDNVMLMNHMKDHQEISAVK